MSESTIKVTVVIATYNNDRYIAEAVQSILDQTFSDFECIVVDDGSTDNTGEILQTIDDARLCVHTLPANCGIATARNIAMHCANGEYIAVMDADDIALPNRLQLQVDYLDSHPQVDFLGGRSIRVNGSIDNEIDRPQHPLEDAVIKARLLLMDGSAMLHPTSMFRIEFVNQHRLWYLPRDASVDHAFWAKCVMAGAKFAALDDVLIYKRRHADNVTRIHRDDKEQRKFAIRKELLCAYYPQLSGSELAAVVNLMDSTNALTLNEYSIGHAAILKAQLEQRSFFGEARGYLNKLLLAQLPQAQRRIRRAGQEGNDVR